MRKKRSKKSELIMPRAEDTAAPIETDGVDTIVPIDSDTDKDFIHISENENDVARSTCSYPISGIENDFHNFETDRLPCQMLKGQIWAIYDDYGMPRRYVKIDLISQGTNAVYVTLLKPNGEQNSPETSWYRPVCGNFTPYSMGVDVSLYSFSHRVSHQLRYKMSRFWYNVVPRRGQVWAIYKDGNRVSSPRLQVYDLVEILTDAGHGLKAVYLVKIEGGYRSLYKRQVKDGVEVSLQIGPNQLDWFSHQVASFRIVNAPDSLLNACFELDPAALPFRVANSSDSRDPKINDRLLLLEVLDCKSMMLKEKLKENSVWALYDDREGLPRRYASFECTTYGREVITWLEPCPTSENEKKWYKAGLPIACGNFRRKKSVLSVDHTMLSHPVQCKWDDGSDKFEIYPKKGEVWGIYKDWQMQWSSDPDRIHQDHYFEYDFVEILTDFKESDGFRVSYLAYVGDSAFWKHINVSENQVQFSIHGDQLYSFSHRILDYKIVGSSKPEEGWLFLDPLVVSLNARTNAALLEDPNEKDEEIAKTDCSRFLQGQIWALYEGPERMPRAYCIVTNTLPHELKVEVMMFKPHPISEEEMEWVDRNLPISCGTFCTEKVLTLKDVKEFSHQVIIEGENESEGENKRHRSFYKIIPQRGEVWAVYNGNGTEHREYQMVEVITPFDRDLGVNVAPLFEVGSSRILFRRHFVKGFLLVKTYHMKQMVQFSHQVPGERIDGDENEMQKGRWKLQLSAIPSHLTPF
ncbi:hypothetical protein Vadar_026317 [Vaccinium darrowii]|uniref:Uncharacterized protein n=1 Tax=Vaccinium darrowii TaxID=229202 RepID=A0ACB7ZLX9_9ERIC|nr:hypothetical protein Vadar_026317 [Vaccinium darrowii]